MLSGARIAVVVPAYNEAPLIERTVRSMPEFVDDIVLVDDGSRDATAEVARSLEEPRLAILTHTRNRGVGAAISTGYRHAFALGADVAAVMAGDAQMDPSDLEPLVRQVIEGHGDYVKGDRLSHPEVKHQMPPLRWVGNHALSRLTSWCCGLVIRDSQCGYTALSRQGAEQLNLRELWPRYGYPNDLLSRVSQAGLKVAEVTVRPVYAEEVSGLGMRDALLTIPYVLCRALSRRMLPRSRTPGSPLHT